MKQVLKKKLIAFWKEWGISIVVALLIATSFKSIIVDWNDVPSGSMRPTILIGDRVFVNKLAYDLKIPYAIPYIKVHIAKWGDPRRGEIVVFFSPLNGKRLIKRVIGVPGDRLEMIDNRLVINGQPLVYEKVDASALPNVTDENLTAFKIYYEQLDEKKHAVMFSSSNYNSQNKSFGPEIIPEGHYWMMGDNRDNSGDSRVFGPVDRDLIVGRSTAVVISKKGSFFRHPRWERFFMNLN